MQWENEADTRARKVLEECAIELSDEAERIARRLRAGAVSADYVDEAAFIIRIRRPSGLGDVLLAIGIGLVGIAAGVWVVHITATTTLHLASWVNPTFVAIACAGFLVAGIGGTLKIKSG